MLPFFKSASSLKSLVLVTLLSLLASQQALAADLAPLRVANQKSLLKILLQVSGELKDVPYDIQFSEFPSAAPLGEALNAGAVDIGALGDAPYVFALGAGAPLKVVSITHAQGRFTTALLVSKNSPIKTVADLKGKKIGVQSGGNQTIFEGFLKANGLTTSDVTMVTTQYDIAPLEAGKYDAHMSYITNEPILAEADGFTPVVLGFADNGLPFVAETFTTTQDAIDNKRDTLKAFLKAEVQGWTDAAKDPAQSAKYAAEKYGKDQDLDVAEQTKEAEAQNTLILTDDVNKNGLFTMTDELVAENIASLKAMGTDITAEKLFDLTLINEVYKENPELITTFTIPTA